MAKALRVINELIDLNDSLIMEMELHGGDTPDTQLDFLNDKIDKAIEDHDRRLLSLLGIVMEYLMDELVEDGWPTSE